MTHFLMVFDRPHGKIVSLDSYISSVEAANEKVKAERLHGGRDLEIVVLLADSKDDLARTHSRYFKTRSQLVDALNKD